jgi:GT2 family glycosyltransferase
MATTYLSASPSGESIIRQDSNQRNVVARLESADQRISLNEFAKRVDVSEEYAERHDLPLPAISIIVPAYNASETLARCLNSIFAQMTRDIEVIVVDNGSTDQTSNIIAQYPVRQIAVTTNRGPGAARNLGASVAKAPILFFLDADAMLGPEGLAYATREISSDSLDAIIGSYDAAPAAHTLVSQYKNLAHHYFHQLSEGPITTFWGACGLVRRELFLSVGGFDEHCALEDVDLGYRLAERGARIRLDSSLQVKHLKCWSLRSFLITDLTGRAIPWTRLFLAYGYLPASLNFSCPQKVAALLAPMMSVLLPLSIARPSLLVPMLVCMAAALVVNRDLFGLLFRRGGLRLAIGGFALHQLYYLNCIAGFVIGLISARLSAPIKSSGQEASYKIGGLPSRTDAVNGSILRVS